jgi:hypothetical protein
MPSKHTQLPSALAGTPLLPVARGGGTVATPLPSAPGVISKRRFGGLMIHHDALGGSSQAAKARRRCSSRRMIAGGPSWANISWNLAVWPICLRPYAAARRPAQLEHRLAQRPGHALQHRGPGQEYPLPGEIRARNSDSMYWLTRLSSLPKETAASAAIGSSRAGWPACARSRTAGRGQSVRRAASHWRSLNYGPHRYHFPACRSPSSSRPDPSTRSRSAPTASLITFRCTRAVRVSCRPFSDVIVAPANTRGRPPLLSIGRTARVHHPLRVMIKVSAASTFRE